MEMRERYSGAGKIHNILGKIRLQVAIPTTFFHNTECKKNNCKVNVYRDTKIIIIGFENKEWFLATASGTESIKAY